MADTGVATPRMLWDPSRESWAALGILTQPTAILFDAEGRQLADWFGELDTDDVLEALARA